MARNGSGTMSIPNSFSSGATITASGHNQNNTDIASELTNSVAADGQTSMTGPLKAANGTAAAPTVTFASDTDTGMYRHGANELGFAVNGTLVGWFDSSLKFWAIGALDVAGTFSLAGVAAFPVPTAQIANDAVTYAKIQNVSATSRLLGRATAGAGDTEEITIGAGLSLQTTTLVSAFPPPAAFKNLSIKVASNTTVTVAADFVTTTDGTTYQTTALSGTVNLGTNGAANALDAGTIAVNTFYSIWAIAKADGTTAGLASTSATAPTLPTGYTFKARIGWVQTINATATLYGTWQLGRRAQYVVGLAQTTALPAMVTAGASGSVTVPTWTAIALARFVPTTASEIFFSSLNTASSGRTMIAPNNSYGSTTSTTNPPPFNFINGGAFNGSTQGLLLLESSNIYYANNDVGGVIFCSGWTDNI